MVAWSTWFERRCGRVGVGGIALCAILVPRWTLAGVRALDRRTEMLAMVAPSRETCVAPTFHSTSAAPILSRNAFDSRFTAASPAPASSSQGVPSPDGVPVCEGVRVSAIAYCEDPSWSFAAFVPVGDPWSTVLRRKGGMIGDRRLEHVGVDRAWLRDGSGLCEARLTDPPPATAPKPAAPVAHRAAAPSVQGIGPAAADGTIRVERALLERLQADPLQLASMCRVAFERDANGEELGLRLGGVRPGTLGAALGLRDGDRLATINGFSMGDPGHLLEAYGRLQGADSIHVELVRQGKPMSIDYEIR